MCCKVLYFILSDDDFEIHIVENLQSKLASCVESYCILHSQDVLSFRNLFFALL